ncbi:hypothetical protein SLA2020_426300 [Shorea laevis]
MRYCCNEKHEQHNQRFVIAVPQPADPPKNPGRGWKKRARAFCQSPAKDAVLSSDQEYPPQQMRVGDSLVGKQKRKAEIFFSRELQHGTITEHSGNKKTKSQDGILDLQEHAEGVAVASTQPRRSL